MKLMIQFLLINVRCLALIITLILNIGAPNSIAAEGFYTKTDLMPSSVSMAWDSVFLVLIDNPTNYHIGTAFLVKKVVSVSNTELYFLTNQHVIKQDCPNIGICQNASLSQDAHFIYKKDGLHFKAHKGVILNQVSVVSVSANPDLALLHVKISNNENNNLLSTIPISSSCDVSAEEPLYTIGFSNVYDRKNPSVPILDQDSIFKRWSRGIFTGYTKSDNNDDENTSFWIGTTVDALGGGSGGPLLNKQGFVVGVIKNSGSGDANGNRYVGNEEPLNLNWQTNAVRCEYLEKFIADGITALK